MTAEEAAIEDLIAEVLRREDGETTLYVAEKARAVARAARVEALGGAARDLDDMAAGWTGDGRTHEVVRLCARTVAARAEEEAGG